MKKIVDLKKNKVVKCEGKSFCYDEKEALLYYVASKDEKVDDEIIIRRGEVIDAIGLSKDNWKENPEYWASKYAHELNEEMKYLKKEFENELKKCK